MTDDWRVYAARGEWQKIDSWKVRGKDREELTDMLEALVPTCVRGHGVETFIDYIRADEAADLPTARAADLFSTLRVSLRYQSDPLGQTFLPAVDLAKQTLLEEEGIEFEGMNDTYFYYVSGDEVIQVRRDIGEAICRKREALLFEGVETEPDPEGIYARHDAWIRHYPWRRAVSLRMAWRAGNFQPNSPADHAIALLSAYESFRREFEADVFPNRVRWAGVKSGLGNKHHRAVSALFIARIGYIIGRHHEALLKKPWEEHAVARLKHVNKNREHGAKGGQAEKKRERYKALDMLARENLNSFLYASDAQAIRKAKELAAKNDKEASEPLFMQGGKPLSRAWFDEWLAHFRQQARQDIDRE